MGVEFYDTIGTGWCELCTLSQHNMVEVVSKYSRIGVCICDECLNSIYETIKARSATSMSSMFENCTLITTVPLPDTNSVLDTSGEVYE